MGPAGIREAHIYGLWAARYAQQPCAVRGVSMRWPRGSSTFRGWGRGRSRKPQATRLVFLMIRLKPSVRARTPGRRRRAGFDRLAESVFGLCEDRVRPSRRPV